MGNYSNRCKNIVKTSIKFSSASISAHWRCAELLILFLLLNNYNIMEKETKVYKGIYISNERKKRPGGRIRCQLFENKIQIYGKNSAIHETQVDWVEIRRYKKEDRGRKNNPRQNKQTGNVPNKSANSKQQKKNEPSKYEGKKEEKDNLAQSQDKSAFKDTFTNDEVKQQKQKKYRLKPVEPKEQSKTQRETDNNELDKLQPNEQAQKPVIEQTSQAKQQLTEAQVVTQKDEEERKQEDNESESSQEQQQKKKDLQIIVGRIVKETNIVFKTRPFVGILNFSKKKGKSKYQEKEKQSQGPMAEILRDFYADIIPIHSRLPIMELDSFVEANRQILDEYALNVLKYDKNAKPKAQLNRVLDCLGNVYILITFSDWDGDYPLARIHKIIGKAMTIDGECDRFLYQHTLNDFNYEQEVKREVVEVKPTTLHRKLQRMVFTIDPPTSTDLDDALSIEPIGDNLFEIGIHIADVSSYLHHIRREEIAKRTTSVYLPNKVYHMLSSNLVKACSLDPGVDRLAFTVWVVMDIQGNVKGESRIQKNMVGSRFKLSYEVVQNLITDNLSHAQFNEKYPSTVEQYDQLLQKLLNLTTIASTHRSKRIVFDVFENREMEFKVDADRWPVQCFVDKRYTAKKVVEEFMIIGNIQAARHLVKADPRSALVIHHPKPSKLSVTSFNEAFKNLQVKFKFDNVFDVQRQLLEIEKDEKIKDEVKQLCFFRARRTMEPAIYRLYNQIMEEDAKREKKQEKDHPIVHFALGLQFYTHFTSPMRRMADILVHQTLTQILKGQPLSALQTEEIDKINSGRKYTKRLKKDLNEVYLCLMVYHTKKPIKTEGIISSFGMESVSIYIPLFDMQKEVMFKKEFQVHSVKRIPRRADQLDVKIYHDRMTKKKDVYWVMKRFERVQLTLACTQNPPLRLTVEMKVQSEKGPYTIRWLED